MTTYAPPAWETTLISLARAPGTALSGRYAPWALAAAAGAPVPAGMLAAAYAYCDSVTAAHSRSFCLASSLLPAAQRRAIRALYAVCRISDDLVDIPGAQAAEALAAWRGRVLAPVPAVDDPVITAWADVRSRYQIPGRYVEQLLDGVARDLRRARYASFESLAAYAYGVASTVGLMSMHIIGFSGPEAVPYAVKLGVALQLTNILRDVGDDWRAGRLYLPADELALFGLSEADVAAGQVTNAWREFMRYQIERNRQLYAEAWPGISLLHPRGRLAIAAAAELYRAILADVESHDYDVFSRRAHVSGARKLRCLLALAGRSLG